MTTHRSDLTGADLVKVAQAHDQVGAEFLQGMLHDVEIPSVVRRAPGFDVPDLLAAGPRDVLVAARDAEVAREVLRMEDLAADEAAASGGEPRPSRLLVGLLLALAVVAGVVCVAVDVLA